MTGETGDGIVQIAYLHPEHVSHSWHDSMRRLRDYDLAHGGKRVAPKPLNIRCGSGRLVPSRNYAVRLFLDKTPHEWFLFVDTDMGFEDDAAHRLLATADPTERPVVGALCFALMESAYDGMGGWRRTIVPTMYKIGTTVETGKPSFCYYGEYPDNTVVPVAATGAAFLLVHRNVLEKVRAEHGDHWFDQFYDADGDMVGEDIAFCARLGNAGIPVHVHTGVKTSHHKEIWLAEDDYVKQATSMVEEIRPELPLYIHLAASFAGLAAYDHDHDGMLKFPADLARYAAIIETTKPEVVVETGSHTGASARWFKERGVDVITVDINRPPGQAEEFDAAGIGYVTGSSIDPLVAAKVAELVAGRRCMVSLDSDHSGPHVAKEIELYGPLVSPGCYLVVEDSIFGYGESARVQQGLDDMEGSPLDAIAEKLHGNPDWSRDIAIELTHPVSQNPAGYWVRVGG